MGELFLPAECARFDLFFLWLPWSHNCKAIMASFDDDIIDGKKADNGKVDNGKVDTAVKFCMYALEMKRLREKMGYLIVRRNEHYDREGVVFFDKVKESLVEWEFAFMNMVELKRGSFAYVALVPLDKIDLAYDLLCLRFESMDMQKPDHEYKKFYDLDIVDFIDWALGENKIPFYSVKHDVTM